MYLIIGKYYKHIGGNNGLIISPRPLKYCGIDIYKGSGRHNFHDVTTGLFHWLRSNEMQEVEPKTNKLEYLIDTATLEGIIKDAYLDGCNFGEQSTCGEPDFDADLQKTIDAIKKVLGE